MERSRSRHGGASSKEAASSSRSSLQISSTSPAIDSAPDALAPFLSSGVGAAASTALVDDGLSDRLASLTLSPGSDKEATATGGGLRQALPEQYDAVIIHDPEDEGKAELFRRNLVGIVGPDLRVTKFGCDASNAGRLHYDVLEDTIRRSTYMLLLVTKKFCAGDGNIMLRDTCLSEMLNNDKKRWCLIPVWTAPEEEYQRPMALRPLTGISEKNMADTFRSQSIIKLFSEKRQHREKRQQEVQERLAREARDRQRKEEELEGQRKHREILRTAEEEIKKQLLSKQREAELEELHARHERAVQEEAHEAELKQTLERLEQGEQVIRHARDQQAFAQWQREQQARMAAQLLAAAAAAHEDAAMAGGSGGGVPLVLHLRGGYASGTTLSGSGGDRSAASAAMAAAATARTAAAVGGSQPSSSGFGPLTANGMTASRAASHQPWPQHGFGPPEGAGGRTAAEAAVQQWQLFQARLQPGASGFVPVAGAASASQAVLPPPYSSSLFDPASGGRGRLPLQDWPALGQHSGPGILPAAAANTIYGPNPWAGSAVAWPSVGPAVAGVPRSGGDGSSPALAAAAAAAVPRLSGDVVPPPTRRAVAAADAQSAHARAPYPAQTVLPSTCRSAADAHGLMSSSVRHEFVSATSVQPCKATQQQWQQQQQSDDRPFEKAAAAMSSPPKPHDVAIMEESYPPAAGGKAKLQTAVDNLAIARKIEGVRDSQKALLNDCTAMMTSRGAPPAAAAAAESVLGTPSEAATTSNRGGATAVPARHGSGGSAARKSTVEASLQQAALAASSRSSSTAVATGPVSSGSRRGPLTVVGATQPLDSAGSIGGSSRAPVPPAVATFFRSPMASMSSYQEPPYTSAPAGPGGSYDQQILATLLQQQQQLQLQQLQLQHLLALYGTPAVAPRPEAPRHFSQQLPPFTATVPTAFGGNIRLSPNSQSVLGSLYELMPATQCLPPPDSPLWATYAGGVSPFGTSAAVGGSAQQQQQQSPAFNDHSPGVRGSPGSVVADNALGRATAYSPLQYLPGVGGYGLPWGPEFGAAAATVPGARAVNEHGLDMPTRFPLLAGRLPSPAAVGDEGLTGRVTPTSLQCSDFSERGAEEAPSEGDQDLARWPRRGNAGSGRERGQGGGSLPRGSQLPEARRSGPMAPTSPVGSHVPSSWAASSRLSVVALSRDSNLTCDDSGTSGSGSSSGGAANESDGGSSSMHSYSGHSSGGDSGQDGANFHELPYADQAAGASSNSGIPATVLQLRDSLAMRQSSRPGQGSSSSTSIDSSSQCRSTSPGHYHIDGGEDASFIKMQPLTMHPPH